MSKLLTIDEQSVIRKTGVGTQEEPVNELKISGVLQADSFKKNNGADISKWQDGDGAIYYNGKVGVGTNAPKSILEISNGNVKDHTGLCITNTVTNHAYIDLNGGGPDGSQTTVWINFTRNSINRGQLGIAEVREEDSFGSVENTLTLSAINNSDIGLCTSPDGKRENIERRLVVKPDGNVGIGTINPSEKFEVNGTIKSIGLEVSGPLKIQADKLIFQNLPDARTAPADADLESVVIDKSTGKLYMQ